MFRSLGIAQKLAVAAMLFLAPVGYVLVALVGNQNTTVAFSDKERVGTFYLRQLAKVHEELAGAALGNGTISSAVAGIIEAAERQFGDGMESADLAKAAASAVRAVWLRRSCNVRCTLVRHRTASCFGTGLTK